MKIWICVWAWVPLAQVVHVEAPAVSQKSDSEQNMLDTAQQRRRRQVWACCGLLWTAVKFYGIPLKLEVELQDGSG